MEKILIIDDEPQVCAVLREILVREGFTVEVAADGQVGLAMWRKKPADLVLTDIFMPNKDGIETILELKRSRPRAKIIAMTGGGEAPMQGCKGEISSTARWLGAGHILYKPFDNRSLLAAIRSVLSEHDPAHGSVASVC